MDILLCSVPYTETNTPILAPALLKSVLVENGYSAQYIDFNFEIIKKIQNNPRKHLLIDFFKLQRINEIISKDIAELIEYCADKILKINPNILGLSLLTQDCQFFTIWLCYHLKSINPNLKIVLGGSGIKSFIAQSEINFGEILRNKKIIDDYINGDGEVAILEYMKSNFEYPGINSNQWNPITDLNALPFADFSDLMLDQYSIKALPICDSRGCVRTCEFCDIIEHWKKYQYRSADNVFKEMLHQIEKHSIRRFVFNNSLTNGNMREFNKLLDLICEYNDTMPNSIYWEGYFIIRKAEQHPENLFHKIKKSNGFLLLGVESVIENVRIGLGKNFTNKDIDYHLQMGKKYNIQMLLLIIVAYPTETKQDFEFTKQWFTSHKEYANNPIVSVVLSLAAILPNTKLDRNKKEYGIIKGEIPTIWMTQANNVSSDDRLLYIADLTSLLKTLNITTNGGDENNLKVLKEEIELMKSKIPHDS
jgi:hypothetical protein